MLYYVLCIMYYSLASGVPVRPRLAMTGEISLTGKVVVVIAVVVVTT